MELKANELKHIPGISSGEALRRELAKALSEYAAKPTAQRAASGLKAFLTHALTKAPD